MRVAPLGVYKGQVGQTRNQFQCKLIVWERAIELCSAVYALTRQFPREEICGLASQVRRELQTQLVIARRFGFVDSTEF